MPGVGDHPVVPPSPLAFPPEYPRVSARLGLSDFIGLMYSRAYGVPVWCANARAGNIASTGSPEGDVGLIIG